MTHTSTTHGLPQEHSSLLPLLVPPPFQGEVRRGVRGPSHHHRPCTPRSPKPVPFPHPHTQTVAHRTHPLSPTPATLTSEQECRTMPLLPQQRRRPPQAAAGNQTLTNADQTVTKVDKTDHRQPPPQTQTPAKHGTIATAPITSPPPVSTPAVNPSGTPRTTLNKSEQIRTDPNKPEHRRTPRPDRTTPRITPEHHEKNQP